MYSQGFLELLHNQERVWQRRQPLYRSARLGYGRYVAWTERIHTVREPIPKSSSTKSHMLETSRQAQAPNSLKSQLRVPFALSGRVLRFNSCRCMRGYRSDDQGKHIVYPLRPKLFSPKQHQQPATVHSSVARPRGGQAGGGGGGVTAPKS